MFKRSVLVVAALALVLSACSKSDGGSDASGSDAKTTTSASGGSGTGSSGSDCSKDADKAGFVRAFCDGTATVSFEGGGIDGTIEGGTCEESGGYFTVNAGTVVGPGWEGAQPDYAGFLLPVQAGDFDGGGITASITSGGTVVLLKDAKGTHDAKSASFTATDMQGGGQVTVSVTC